MKRGAVSTVVFSAACVSAAFLSFSVLGGGMWAYVLIAAGLLSVVSPYFTPIQPAVGSLAMVGGVLALVASLLGCLAATIGGSFRLPGDQALLLLLLAIIGVTGIVIGKVYGARRNAT